MAQRQFKSTDTSKWNEKYGNGSDGAGSSGSNVQTTFVATIGSTSATAGSGTGFANGNLILIHQSRNGGTGVGNWELNKISSVGGGTDWTLSYATIYAYDTTAQVYLMKQYSSYNGTLAVGTAWDGTKGGIAGFFCNGNATISGGSSNGTGYVLGIGGPLGGADGKTGEGTSGASIVSTSANGNGAGGANNSADGGSGGGGGGHGATGTAGSAGTGGSTVGAAGGEGGAVALTTMVFGGGGGGGGYGSYDSQSGQNGGAGGGLLFVIAKTITISGAITNGGNTATNGDTSGGAGGGGAGGSVLLKGQTIILGSGLLTASGGAGGAQGGGGHYGGAGGAGAVGRIHADYLISITGTTTPTIDSTQDSTLSSGGGAFLLNFV